MNAKEQLAAWIRRFGRIPTVHEKNGKIVRCEIGLGDGRMPIHIPLGVVTRRGFGPDEDENRIRVDFWVGELSEEQCDGVLRRIFGEA